jgi:hypothetical protein
MPRRIRQSPHRRRPARGQVGAKTERPQGALGQPLRRGLQQGRQPLGPQQRLGSERLRKPAGRRLDLAVPKQPPQVARRPVEHRRQLAVLVPRAPADDPVKAYELPEPRHRPLAIQPGQRAAGQHAQRLQVADERAPLAPSHARAAGLQGGKPLVDLGGQMFHPLLGRQFHAQPPLQFGPGLRRGEQDFRQPLRAEPRQVLRRHLLLARCRRPLHGSKTDTCASGSAQRNT